MKNILAKIFVDYIDKKLTPFDDFNDYTSDITVCEYKDDPCADFSKVEFCTIEIPHENCKSIK